MRSTDSFQSESPLKEHWDSNTWAQFDQAHPLKPETWHLMPNNIKNEPRMRKKLGPMLSVDFQKTDITSLPDLAPAKKSETIRLDALVSPKIPRRDTLAKGMETSGLMHKTVAFKDKDNNPTESIIIGRMATRGKVMFKNVKLMSDQEALEAYKPMDLTAFKRTRDAMILAMERKSDRYKRGIQLHKEKTIVNKSAASKFKNAVKAVESNYTLGGLGKQKHFMNLAPMYEAQRKDRVRKVADKMVGRMQAPLEYQYEKMLDKIER